MRLRNVGILAAAVAGMMWGVSATKAASVEVDYTTSGAFSSTQSVAGFTIGLTNSNQTLTITNSGGTTLSLAFAGDSSNVQVITPITSSLGTFTESWSGGTSLALPANTNLATFTLTITQTVPSSGSGTSGGNTENVFGTITTNSGGLSVQLDPNVVNIGIVSYAPQNLGGVNNDILSLTTGNPGVTTLNANITAVPVPAAAWMGLSMLAGLAGMGLVRRRRSA